MDFDDPRLPAKYEDADVIAIQAVAKEHPRALKWIVETLCCTYDLSYRPDPYDTAFAEGKRYVGLQIVKLTKLNLEALRKTDGRNSHSRADRDPDKRADERSAE